MNTCFSQKWAVIVGRLPRAAPDAASGLLLALALSAIAMAQTTTGSLVGIVRDNTGAVVPDVEVTAQNAGTSFTRSAMSDETGSYLITNLPVGEYTVTARKQGFAKFVQNGVTLVVGQNARVDVALSLGDVTQSVTVTAESTGVETRSTTVGELVDRTRIQELPLNGRNAMALALVVPGVISVTAPTIVSQSRSGPTITVAGGRNTQNEFRIDGISNKNLTQNTALNFPNPDALQEFTIMTSNYSAEYGRNSGGVIMAVTRAGTNDFHGTLWEYLRNTDLNARNFFSTTKPTLVQNQYGFTLGGPVIHNKLFFFGSYQGTEIRQSQLLATARPPTALERQGNFSASAIKPIDPLTGQPFPGAAIPASRFDPTSVAVMNKYMPAANTSDGRWVDLNPEPSTDNQYLGRVDYIVNPKNTLDFRYFRDNSDLKFQSGNIAPYAPNDQSLQVGNWALHDTHTFGPTLLNELRLGVDRDNSLVGVTQHDQLSNYGAAFPGVITPQMPSITVSGYYSLATTDIFSEHGNIYQIGDNLRWFKGKHSISFGGEWERTEEFNRGSSSNQGVFTFSGYASGNAWADYLLGKPSTMTQNSPYERLVKGWDWYAYVEDDIRLTSRFMLNLGLRYEWYEPYHAVYNRTNTYRAGEQSTVLPNAPPGMVFPGDKGIPPGLVPDDPNNFAPRVGFAWDPFGNGKLSIRSAYGLFYEDMRTDIWTYPAVNQPFVISDTVPAPYSFSDPYHGIVDPFPYVYSPSTAKFSFPMSLFTVPAPTLNSPYAHEMNFTVEKTLPFGMILKAGYVGKLEHNLLQMLQKNPAVYIPGQSTLANTNQRRILLPGTYASFRQIATNSNASYNSLEASLSRRFSKGLTFLASYTFGKLLDYYSAQNLGQTPQDPYNERLDRARSDEDRSQVFSGSFVYEIPFLRNGKGLLAEVFGGWSLSGLITMATGLPVYVISGQDFSLTGVGFDRPNLVGNSSRSHSSTAALVQEFFNTAAFAANLPGEYGTAGRNLFSGPGISNTNLSLVKSFRISERFGQLQFRSEFFNTFNQVSFGQPDGTLVDKTFGQIQTAADPRILQFALRYQF
ncbi:MAG TPA: carboxypeptidase regulatory-like domain-containing protein [Bryobacteraceae bacterium]|nr:carboxypeptidase regulatory-like domain-containing protein [Bryobacteraceae bacterium]